MARKPRKEYEGKKERGILLKMDPALLDDVDILARRDGVSRSEFIRSATAAVINRRYNELETTRAFFAPPTKRPIGRGAHQKPPARQEEAPQATQEGTESVARALDIYAYIASRQGRTMTGYTAEYDTGDGRRDFLAICLQDNGTARLVWIAFAELCHLSLEGLEDAADVSAAFKRGIERATHAPGYAALLKRHSNKADKTAKDAAIVISNTGAEPVKDKAGAIRELDGVAGKLVALMGAGGVPIEAQFAAMT